MSTSLQTSASLAPPPGARDVAPRRRRWRRLGAALVGGLVLALAAACFGLRASLPRTRGTLALPGLRAPVTVVRDAAGVPHIVAATDRDALMALGFVHAQDRLWQMEWQRRVGAGRLSEVVGEGALDIDRFLRTLGTYRAAEAAYWGLGAEGRDLLDAYVGGVNAFLASGHPLPPEFLALQTRPEPWRAADSLVWAKMMAWNLGGNWDMELLRAWLEHRVGALRAAELLPEYPADGPTILGSAGVDGPPRAAAGPRGGAPGSSAPVVASAARLLDLDGRLRRELRLGGPGVGSNGWVVAGRRTASGMPLLANDPHLGTQIPSQWYLAAIHGDRLHVVGGTLPGLPGVVIGRNARVAWGFTNLGADVQDIYVERLDPSAPNRVWDGGRWQPLAIVTETIQVRGRAEPVLWAARASRHGPLVSDALDEVPPAVAAGGFPTALALRWTALDPEDGTLEAFVALDRAGGWDAFLAATRGFDAPSQNVVYADVEGRIGYTATGRIPIRAAGDGRRPVPGWSVAHDWTGYVPRDALPRAVDPDAGWIVTANQRVTRAAEPFLTDDWALPYRAARIEDALEAAAAGGRRLAAEDVAAIQLDTGSAMALALKGALERLPAASARQAAAIARVAAWDGDNRAGDVAPTVVQAWLVALVGALVADDLDDARLASYLTQDDLNHRNAEFALQALARDDGSWCDDRTTPAREACAALALRALDEALDALEQRLGGRMEGWRWGRVHRTQFPHAPLSEVALLRPLVQRSIAAGGDAFSPNVGAPSWATPFDHDHAAGYREIIDLGAPEARFSVITGQSGHPLSPHYADRIRPHRDGHYLTISLEPPQSGARLRLEPADATR